MRQRILVHDYSGHPFQPQLSRKLAARGHQVLHAYSKSVVMPQGQLAATRDDPWTLDFRGIALPAVINKQAYFQRWLQERAYGRMLAEQIRRFEPDIVCSANTPLDAQACALAAARETGARFVFWLQDLQGIAMETLLGGRFNGFGTLVGARYRKLEARLLRESDAVVAITDDFAPELERLGVDAHATHVIPNWAALNELPPRPKDNAWARAHGLADKFCYLYSGTLGLKHDPEPLLQLACAHRDDPSVRVVVVSEGAKADWLQRRKQKLALEGLVVLPFQPYRDLADVMGTADVLVALLDADAGAFSVPSKVLSYHCAGRALLVSVPADNLAARIVGRAHSGLVTPPGDVAAFLDAARRLQQAPDLRRALGTNARRYAVDTFNLERIADRFEALFRTLPRTTSAEEALADEPA